MLQLTRLSLLGVWAGFALAASPAAQTFIVDDNGGPGVSFTDLPQAIAAVPPGAVLRVRPGSYSAFTVANKSISILGDARATVQVGGGHTIGPTGAGDSVLLTDLSFADMGRVVGAEGPAVVKACSYKPRPNSAAGLETDASPNVHLHDVVITDAGVVAFLVPIGLLVQDSAVEVSRCVIRGSSGSSIFGGSGACGMRVSSSQVTLVDGSVTGGDGSFDMGHTPPGNGGVGIQLAAGSTLLALGARISGGAGGGGVLNPGAPGGAGIVATGGSTARCEGAAPQGGAGGQPGGAAGAPWTADASSTVLVNATSMPALGSIAGTPAIGGTVMFTVTAKPGSAAWLLAGAPRQTPLQPIVLGSLFTTARVAIPAGLVPASGTLQLSATVPAGWLEDVPLYTQFATFEPSGRTAWASNSSCLLIKSP